VVETKKFSKKLTEAPEELLPRAAC